MLARRAKRTSVVLEFASFTNFSRCASSSSIALAFRIAASKVHVHLGVGQLQIVLLNTKHYTSVLSDDTYPPPCAKEFPPPRRARQGRAPFYAIGPRADLLPFRRQRLTSSRRSRLGRQRHRTTAVGDFGVRPLLADQRPSSPTVATSSARITSRQGFGDRTPDHGAQRHLSPSRVSDECIQSGAQVRETRPQCEIAVLTDTIGQSTWRQRERTIHGISEIVKE